MFCGITALASRLQRDRVRRKPHFFPGYIFARFDGIKVLHRVHFVRGVAYVVSFGGMPAAISDDVIGEIYSRMDANGVIRDWTELNPGDHVVIRSGPLRNFVGAFERDLPGPERVQILLHTVAYSAHVEVSRLEVAKIAS